MRVVDSKRLRIGGEWLPFGSAGRAFRREGLLLRLIAADGREGVGEASPLPGYSPDSLEDASRALDAIHLSIAGVSLAGNPVESVAHALSPAAGILARSPSAAFAVETALLDLLGQCHGVPMHQLLGREQHRSLPCAALLSAPLRRESVEEAHRLMGQGVTVIKAKIGRSESLATELAVLNALRESLPSFTLRLDANGAWNAADASAVLQPLAALAPEYVEEPCSGPALVNFSEAATGGLACAADESLRDFEAPLLAAGHIRAVVLKPACLGLLRARRIGWAAVAAGKLAVLSHVFDGPVAMAAACELALSLPGAAHGLAPHPGLAAYSGWAIPQHVAFGEIRPVGGAGLGFGTRERREAS